MEVQELDVDAPGVADLRIDDGRLRGAAAVEGEFLLVVERRARQVERLLFEAGELRERSVRELDEAGNSSRERLFEDGTIRREIAFTPDGRRRYLKEFDADGLLQRETRYSYQGDRVVLRRVLDAEGDERYRDALSYYAAGGLRRLERTWSDGRTRTVHYSMVGGDILQERFERDGEGRLVRYDAQQRPVYEREWQGDSVIREAVHRYEGDESNPSRTEERLPVEGRRVVRRFDDQGRLLSEEEYEDERLVRETRHSYGPYGRTETVVETRAGTERRSFNYEGERLAEERVFEDGTLSRVIRYRDERSRVEERYRGGEVFARIYYEDDTAVREEILRDGEVVDRRELR
jgi:antitoxin component YwqK of YwqJK toxin-antitoxin module